MFFGSLAKRRSFYNGLYFCHPILIEFSSWEWGYVRVSSSQHHFRQQIMMSNDSRNIVTSVGMECVKDSQVLCIRESRSSKPKQFWSWTDFRVWCLHSWDSKSEEFEREPEGEGESKRGTFSKRHSTCFSTCFSCIFLHFELESEKRRCVEWPWSGKNLRARNKDMRKLREFDVWNKGPEKR